MNTDLGSGHRMKSFISDILSLSYIIVICIEILNRQGKVLAGDYNLEFISIKIVFNAMGWIFWGN